MSFSDDTLMAYADGELGEPERSAVAAAERDDPAVAAAIARHRALRADVFAAFAGVLEEPVPAPLQAAAAAAGREPAPAPATAAAERGNPGLRNVATIASLDAARERKAKAREAADAARAAGAGGAGSAGGMQRRAWPRWGALAASLAVGVLAGSLWLGGNGGAGGGLVATDSGGRLVARGELADALSRQLAGSSQARKPVQIGVSFATRDGGYCRSFRAGASAGLACRAGEDWRIPVLRDAPADTNAYRQAGGSTPAAVLDAIDERIEGPALDAAAERAARDRGWKR